jgi:hypothetical protein
MKACKLLSLSLLALFTMMACTILPLGTSLNLSLSSDALNAAARAGNDQVRVQLWQNNRAYLFPNGLNYLQSSYDGPITIDNVPAGDNYEVQLAIGSGGAATFSPARYAISPKFAIVPGVKTSIALSLSDTPLTVHSQLASSVALVGSTLYQYSGTTLQEFGGDPVSFTTPGISINSIDAGLNAAGTAMLYVNTTNGIYIPPNTLLPNMTPNQNVKQSWAFRAAGIFTQVFYNAGGVNLGMGLFNGVDTPEWHHLGTALGANAGLFDSGNDILTSVASNSKAYYVGSSYNALRLGISESNFWDYFNGGGVITADMQFGSPDTKSAVRLLTATEDHLWLAGFQGLYVRNLDGDGKFVGAWSPITVLGNERIVGLASFAYAGNEYMAAVSATGRLVITRNGTIIRDIPAIAGVPKTNLRLIFRNDVTNVQLFVAGKEGLVQLEQLQL